MEAQKVRLTLDLNPTFQRRLKAIAALRGVSLQRYCQTAIHRKLAKDEDEAFEHLSYHPIPFVVRERQLPSRIC